MISWVLYISDTTDRFFFKKFIEDLLFENKLCFKSLFSCTTIMKYTQANSLYGHLENVLLQKTRESKPTIGVLVYEDK